MKIHAISTTYQKNVALRTPSLELEQGKIYAVIGANGSGKTTFARLLAGTLSPDEKTVPIQENIRIGYMPQKSYAFRMSVKANILLGGKNPQRAKERMRELGLSHLAKQRAERLSGGETARMALARLLMRDYDLLILDEPTASMDIEATTQAEEIIRRYCRANRSTVIWVTHSLQQAQRVSDEVLFFSAGTLVERGKPALLFKSPATQQLRQFLQFYEMNFEADQV